MNMTTLQQFCESQEHLQFNVPWKPEGNFLIFWMIPSHCVKVPEPEIDYVSSTKNLQIYHLTSVVVHGINDDGTLLRVRSNRELTEISMNNEFTTFYLPT